MKKLCEAYGQLCVNLENDREKTVFEMTQSAARVLFEAVQENYYKLSDLQGLNYSEICSWLDWPDLQDGGIFEHIIDMAADIVLRVLGYRPQHIK